jgi:hypothetical protein
MAFRERSPSEQQIVLQGMKALADGRETEDREFQTKVRESGS